MIEESKALLHRHSSDLSFDDEDDILINTNSLREKRPSVAGNVLRSPTSLKSPTRSAVAPPLHHHHQQQPISILGTKHLKEGLPIIKDMKVCFILFYFHFELFKLSVFFLCNGWLVLYSKSKAVSFYRQPCITYFDVRMYHEFMA